MAAHGFDQRPQRPHADGAGGGAVAVVVGHDDHASSGGDGIGQQAGRVIDALELRGRQQISQPPLEFLALLHAACRQQAGQLTRVFVSQCSMQAGQCSRAADAGVG